MWLILNSHTATSLKKKKKHPYISCYIGPLSENFFFLMSRFKMGWYSNYRAFWESVWAAQVWTLNPITRTDITVPSPHSSSSTPACTLPALNGNILKTGAYQKQLGLSQNCVLFSLLDPTGTWIYFSRRGDRFALLAILSGPLWDVCERNERCVICRETQ